MEITRTINDYTVTNRFNEENFVKNLNNSAKADGKLFDKIGNNLESARGTYFNALAKGDQAEIAKAQDKYQRYMMAMNAALEFLSSKFQIMMSMISKLSLR